MYTATQKDAPAKGAKNSATHLREEGLDTIYEIKDDIQGAAVQAGRKVRDFIDTASDEISNAGETVSKQVRTNPLQSGLIALGAGFILGSLFRR